MFYADDNNSGTATVSFTCNTYKTPLSGFTQTAIRHNFYETYGDEKLQTSSLRQNLLGMCPNGSEVYVVERLREMADNPEIVRISFRRHFQDRFRFHHDDLNRSDTPSALSLARLTKNMNRTQYMASAEETSVLGIRQLTTNSLPCCCRP